MYQRCDDAMLDLDRATEIRMGGTMLPEGAWRLGKPNT